MDLKNAKVPIFSLQKITKFHDKNVKSNKFNSCLSHYNKNSKPSFQFNDIKMGSQTMLLVLEILGKAFGMKDVKRK
jgi:hypothetical protein